MKVKIGCSGWMYSTWKEIFYPKEVPQREWFSFYRRYFDCVEINSSFYHFPTSKTIKNWYQKTPQDFSFSLKANRAITHLKKFHDTQELVQQFYDVSSGLKEKLDNILFQMPPSFKYSADNFELVLQNLDSNYVNIIEFRHSSWWREEIFEKCRLHNVVFCSVSAKNLPGDVISTNGNVYLRFHERVFGDCYTDKELLTWASKIQQAKANNIWVYFNNDGAGHAPANALLLKQYFM